MRQVRHTGWAVATALLAVSQASAQAPRAMERPPRPTAPAITVADLQTRLYTFAHDSMMGREAGTPGHDKATEYLAAEMRKLGLQPAGENGTFFQTVPLVRRAFDEQRSSLSVDGKALAPWTDYAASLPTGAVRPIEGAQVVFGGVLGDTANMITAEQAAGKIVVLAAPPGARSLGVGSSREFPGAAALAITNMDAQFPAYVNFLKRSSIVLRRAENTPLPATILLPTSTAALLLGAPVEGMRPGTTGRTVTGKLAQTETPLPTRNVIAVLPGSDPALRGQYVAIGSHSDHDGVRSAVEHDSLRAFNAVLRPEGAGSRAGTPTAEQAARIRTALDSLRRLRPARTDSIMNGADDDGSGSVAMLEIAEAYAKGAQRPRRSTLFVWHTAEEKGLIGARHFTDNPTVPRDSIVAHLNIDMIGRGGEADLAKGGPGYLQLLGTRRLSTELGDLVETANKARKQPFAFDYSYDAEGHPEQYYCRSDHAMYARYGIPIVFFTTGSHRDYHQLTDEAQYIDYGKLANVTQFIADVGLRVANLDHRVMVDKPKPDPKAPCRQ